MTERLGAGELTTHYRRHVEGVRQQIECGVPHGCITAVIEDVTCSGCKAVARLADERAEQCGCRNGHVHRGAARAVIEALGAL